MFFIPSRFFRLFSIIILIKKNVLLQQYKTHKKNAAAYTAARFVCYEVLLGGDNEGE
ncbi:hypothetical protein HMPREF1992_02124 [Selenomonas sp. oral taxon 892 str. F0426]|nr:hypothetical protein HMPREF1992_02124 [Selenomonas sp. oral taxon 892 str. F0426]